MPAQISPALVDKKLDLVDKLYQRSILPSVLRVAAGERLEAPLVVDLDPTTLCDLTCPECISKQIINHGQLAKDRLVTLAAELAASPVKAVVLIGGGEPLMHKSIGQVITTLGEAGIHLGLVTNGTLLHRYINEIATYLSWTRVSMDSATAETHAIFRPSGRSSPVFPQIVDNMRQLAKLKKGALGYSFLLMYRLDERGEVQASNYHELAAAGHLAKEIGCDYLEIKAFFDDGHFIHQPPGELRQILDKQMESLLALEGDNFRILESSTARSMLTDRPRVQVKNYTRCLTAEIRATITPTGVYTCPPHRGRPEARTGSIANQSLQEMWKNATTDMVNPSVQCGFHCARHDTNLEIELLGRSVTAHAQVEDYDLFV